MTDTQPTTHTPEPKRTRRIIAIAVGAGVVFLAIVGIALTGQRGAAIAHLFASPTLTPSHTPTPSITPSPLDSPTPGPSPTASVTPSPSLTPSATPTAKRKGEPTLWIPFTPTGTQITPVPPPAARYQFDKGVVNLLLLGSDISRHDIQAGAGYQTDTIIVASVNKEAGYVSLLSIPRDLYVYLPGVKMGRINTADLVGKPFFPGGGPAYLGQTILYNLGLPIDYYARINFDGFQSIVNTLGGIEVPVSCAIQDWRLKSPELDPQVEDNWYLFTQETGVIHMDGDLALWYARSRKNNTDFDRSRRQMQVLRAIFQKAKTLNLTSLTQIPALYEQFKDVVQTDMDIGEILRLAPMAVDLDTSRIRSYSIGASHTSSWTTPDNPPQNVLIPNPDAIASLLDRAFSAPDDLPAPIFVEVWNGTPNADWLALAADNLRAKGLAAVAGNADRQDYPRQVLYDFTTGADTTTRANLQKLFGVKNENVIAQPDASAPYPYRIVLGADWNSCIYPVPPPKPTPKATP